MMKETNPISAICLKWIKILENSSAEFLEDPHTNLVFSFIKKLKDGLAVLLQNLYSLQNLRQYKKQKKYAMI